MTISREGKKRLIQVAAKADEPETQEREKRAIEEAERETGIKGELITMENFLSIFYG